MKQAGLLLIAWETGVWCADAPTHRNHFHGDRFLGPYAMPPSKTHPSGWISVDVRDTDIAWARELRAERDRLYPNIYTERESDMRWVGELAEKVFKGWLIHVGVSDFHWLRDSPVHQPDFVLANGQRIGVKAVKRQVAPRPEYTAQITAEHRNEPVDHFFFMTYQFPAKRMWLLGGSTKEQFLATAKYFGAGSQVHENYVVREGHEIYNGPIGDLMPPEAWLASARRIPDE